MKINKTLSKIQSILKAILYFGLKNGYTDKIIPFKFVQNKSERNSEMDFYTPEEFNKFISFVDHTVYNAFFTILYFCGLRKGEALALLWGDVNFSKSEVTINKFHFLNSSK